MLYRDLIGLGHSLTSEDQDKLKCQLKNASYSYKKRRFWDFLSNRLVVKFLPLNTTKIASSCRDKKSPV